MDHESLPQGRMDGPVEEDGFVMESMYDLSERDYQGIIHRLVDAVSTSIGSLRENGRVDEVQELADGVTEILLDYDEDMAEQVRFAAYGEEEPADSGLGAARNPFLL